LRHLSPEDVGFSGCIRFQRHRTRRLPGRRSRDEDRHGVSKAQPASRGTHPDRGPRDRGAPRCGPAPVPPASPPPARPPAISATTTVCARPGHDRGEDQRAERGDGSTARSETPRTDRARRRGGV